MALYLSLGLSRQMFLGVNNNIAGKEIVQEKQKSCEKVENKSRHLSKENGFGPDGILQWW
jgi:hypothetical protein